MTFEEKNKLKDIAQREIAKKIALGQFSEDEMLVDWEYKSKQDIKDIHRITKLVKRRLGKFITIEGLINMLDLYLSDVIKLRKPKKQILQEKDNEVDSLIVLKRLGFKTELLSFIVKLSQDSMVDEDFAIKVLKAIERLNESE